MQRWVQGLGGTCSPQFITDLTANRTPERLALNEPWLAREPAVAPESLQDHSWAPLIGGCTLCPSPVTFSKAELFWIPPGGAATSPEPCGGHPTPQYLGQRAWGARPEGVTGVTSLRPPPVPQNPLVPKGNVGVFVVGNECYFPSG